MLGSPGRNSGFGRSVVRHLDPEGGEGAEGREGLGATTHLCRHVDGEHRPLAGRQGLQDALGDGRLSGPHGTHQQGGILVGHQGAHQVVVANGVDRGHHDLVEGGTREESEPCPRGLATSFQTPASSRLLTFISLRRHQPCLLRGPEAGRPASGVPEPPPLGASPPPLQCTSASRPRLSAHISHQPQPQARPPTGPALTLGGNAKS